MALNPFQLLFQISAITPIEGNEGFFAGQHHRITNVSAEPCFACEKRNDHGVPFGSFRLVRGDQLDRMVVERFGFAYRVKVASQRAR